jgi:hypothetical protein
MGDIFANQFLLFCFTVAATVVVTRLLLMVFPKTNIYIGKRNVHHLYTGAAFLIVATTFFANSVVNTYTVALAGVAAGLVLDELVYLTTTTGKDKDYFTRSSYTKAFISVAAFLTFAVVVSVI